MVSRVCSKLSIGAAVLMGGVFGQQLQQPRETNHRIPDTPQKASHRDAILSRQKENSKTILTIVQSLEEFTACSAPRNPSLDAYVQKAKVQCWNYLHHYLEEEEEEEEDSWLGRGGGRRGRGRRLLEMRLSNWEESTHWVDSVDFWPPPPTRLSLTLPTYRAALFSGIKALWYISCEPDYPKGEGVLVGGMMEALGRIVKEEALSQAAPLALKVVANTAVHHQHRAAVRQAGLVEVLTTCADHPHPYVFLPAWRGLHNLRTGEGDGDGTSKCSDVYCEGVYPFMAPEEDQASACLDIVLVHGVEGGAPWTWRQGDTHTRTHKPFLPQTLRRNINNMQQEVLEEYSTCCWPLDWLAATLNHRVRVLALDYQARWSTWGSEDPTESDGKTLAQHSQEMRRVLQAAGIGRRPILWITHSMGGILLKHMLAQDAQSTPLRTHNSNTANLSQQHTLVGGCLAAQTRAVVFCSVPHGGSGLATTTTTWPISLLLRPSREVREMRTDNPALSVIHKSFLCVAEEAQIAVLSLMESRPTQHWLPGCNLHFVAPKQADAGIGEFCEVEATHLDICKPADRNSEVYKKIQQFLKQVVDRL